MSFKNIRVVPIMLSVFLILSSVTGCNNGSTDGPTQAVNTAESKTVEEKAVTAGGHKVTFVELGSVNCIPCRMMVPVMEKIEKTYPGQVKIVFHDVWTPEGKTSGAKYAIRVIPTQVFLDKDGKEYFRHEGFFPFEEVDKILKQKGVK
ncbi:MAG: thioredoxin [Spirochaetae bacterium HGW-Spirochaetae-5]|nr:MAG: thioredoxin [Spirochaetae bacterium HGW-Spirochaetae-5]